MMSAEVGVGAPDSRKAAIRRYFTPSPDPEDELRYKRLLRSSAVLAMITLAVLFFTSVLLALPLGLLSLATLPLGLASLVMLQIGFDVRSAYYRQLQRSEPKPTDDELDKLITEDLHRAATRALHRLELTRDELELRSDDVDPLAGSKHGERIADQGRGPITVFGPAEGSRARIGTDRKWRFNKYDIMVICPTGHHLGIFECALDMETGRRRNEETHEYYYMDVVAVSTTTTKPGETFAVVIDRTGRHQVRFGRTLQREFQIVVSSSDRSSIIVGIRDEDDPDTTVILQESGIDKVIGAVRRMLREKKGGVTPAL